MTFPTTDNKVKGLTNEFLETLKFPQCIGRIVDTHIEVAKLNERYPDYINRKGIVECICKCCAQNLVIKWSRRVSGFP